MSNRELPDIIVNEGQIRDVITKAWGAVIDYNAHSDCPTYFNRHGSLVRVGSRSGYLQIESVDRDSLNSMLIRLANWFRLTPSGARATVPSDRIAKDMLSKVDARMPRIICASNLPILLPSGELVKSDGYNGEFEFLLRLSSDFKKSPSFIGESEQAKNYLIGELLADFPFDTESDQANYIAVLLLPFVRFFICGATPLHLIEASYPGSGKSLLASILSIVTTGVPSTARTLARSEDEVKKMIGAELLLGRPIVVLDNADSSDGRIHSPTLAAVLTTSIWTDRVLGYSKMMTMPNHAIWILTGNSPMLSRELVRRTVSIKLSPDSDQPWKRDPQSFRHPSILKWAKENRSIIVDALLSLIEEWNVKGRPLSRAKMGSFESWAAVVGGILEANNIKGFLGNSDRLIAYDEEADWAELCKVWFDVLKAKPVRPGQVLEVIERFDLLEDLMGGGSKSSKLSRLGKKLKVNSGRFFANYKIELVKDRKTHGKQYVVKKVSNDRADGDDRVIGESLQKNAALNQSSLAITETLSTLEPLSIAASEGNNHEA